MRQLFAATALLLLLMPAPSRGQGPFKAPKTYPPDAETLRQIQAKTGQLRKAVAALREKEIGDEVLIEVEIYLKAAENIVRFEEWLHANSVKWAMQTLDQGLERATQAVGGKPVWREAVGRWVVRAYRSEIDGSIQPYAVLLPHDYLKDRTKKWRMDVVLHGRDSSLTEAKFIATHGTTSKEAPKDLGYIQVEVYGRGNNAYRWAGEKDVFEVMTDLHSWGREGYPGPSTLDDNRVVLRGFSMGGAGTWHIGLHRPARFCVIGPGAGFTTTHGYIAKLPNPLPEYQEKCLRIYDAHLYAENVFNVPVVAYSGEKDPQKKAADNIERALKDFKEPHHFTHLVAPGLAHQMPREWQDRAEAEYRRFADGRSDPKPKRVRFVTYTPKYDSCFWLSVDALETTYERAVADGTRVGNTFDLKTTNLRRMILQLDGPEKSLKITVDGQAVDVAKVPSGVTRVYVERVDGKWAPGSEDQLVRRVRAKPEKRAGLQGPIDDAFTSKFIVIKPTGPGFHAGTDRHVSAAVDQFAALWDRYFRGVLPIKPVSLAGQFHWQWNEVLFGDPQSNPHIAKLLPGLPITWTKEKLVVNGVEYDPRSHVPVLIYPHPLNHWRYVVINSGHTFKEADLKGTNALLYPRLGDWAVLKVAPTKDDPAAAEVVAAGLFDENWQFVKADQSKSFLAPGSKVDKLWGDGEFTEGPAPGPDGAIYFSDIGNRIMRFDPKSGKTTAFRDPGGRSNGLKFDAKGRLVACEGANTGGNRRISVTEPDGTVKTLADRYQGKRFNSPNDLTIDAKGRIYFTDPRYVGDEPRELDHESVYRVDPDGSVARVVADVTKPNGIVISPDGKTLYLSEHHPKGPRQLLAYPLRADGTVGDKKVLFDFGDDRGIDGMTVAADGTIVATAGKGATGGIHFFSPDGKKLGFLPTPEDPNNCCFAGPGSRTLYVTAGKSLYRVELTVVGR